MEDTPQGTNPNSHPTPLSSTIPTHNPPKCAPVLAHEALARAGHSGCSQPRHAGALRLLSAAPRRRTPADPQPRHAGPLRPLLAAPRRRTPAAPQPRHAGALRLPLSRATPAHSGSRRCDARPQPPVGRPSRAAAARSHIHAARGATRYMYMSLVWPRRTSTRSPGLPPVLAQTPRVRVVTAPARPWQHSPCLLMSA